MEASNCLPASCLFLLLFLPAVRVAVVPVAVPSASPTVVSVVQAEIPQGGIPTNLSEGCKNAAGSAGCGIHVFRVALSSRPDEVGDIVPVKARKKYGGNVFVPRGSQDSFVLKDLVENIPAYIDPKVKDRIHEKDFVIKPVEKGDLVWFKDADQLPSNFEPMRKSPPPPPHPSPPSPGRFPLFATVLLVIAGILFGVVASVAAFICLVYSRRPFIDRSAVVVHRREILCEAQALSSLERSDYPPLPSVRSISTSNSSSRTPRTSSRRHRRHHHQPRRDSVERLQALPRKISY